MHFFQTNTFPLTGPLSQTCQPGLQCTPLTPLVRLPQGSSLSTSTVHPPPQAGENVFWGESSRYSNCSVKALSQFSEGKPEALKPRDQGIAQGKSQGRLYATPKVSTPCCSASSTASTAQPNHWKSCYSKPQKEFAWQGGKAGVGWGFRLFLKCTMHINKN